MDWVACLVLEDVLAVCLKFRPVNTLLPLFWGSGRGRFGLDAKECDCDSHHQHTQLISLPGIRQERALILNRDRMVLGRGIEPLWCHHRRILSPLRLPVPPPEHDFEGIRDKVHGSLP